MSYTTCTIRKRVNRYSLFGREPKDFFNNADVWSRWISAQTPPTNCEHSGGGVLTWTWAPYNHWVVHELHCITKWSLHHITWQQSQAHRQICKRRAEKERNQSVSKSQPESRLRVNKYLQTSMNWSNTKEEWRLHQVIALESRTTSYPIRASS